MQIKKYSAPTLREATELMKEELGEEALILSTHVIPGDVYAGRDKTFEITAGVDGVPGNYSKYSTPAAAPIRNSANSFQNELEAIRQKVYVGTREKIKPAAKEVKNSKDILDKLKKTLDVLYNNEVDKSIISFIVKQVKEYKSFLKNTDIQKYVVSTLASMIPTYNFEIKKRENPYLVSFVGPTGVGKTTCVAKLAVISKILHNLDVGLITIDTFRLGAIDQLRIFSDISNVELNVVYELEDIPAALNKLKKKDIIFIDTAGRSQNNINSLKKTKEFLDRLNVDETFLVLNSTSSSRNLVDVAKKFDVFDYKAMIFSKLDEAISFGNIVNVANKTNKPVSFLTNGQVIPDDIISADADYIAKLIYSSQVTS